MDKQRDILIERLEQKLKERDQRIAEMVKSPPVAEDRVAEDRITALEMEVKELKDFVYGILDELLYQKSVIDEMEQKDVSIPEDKGDIESTEYIIAENTPEMRSEYGRQDDSILIC